MSASLPQHSPIPPPAARWRRSGLPLSSTHGQGVHSSCSVHCLGVPSPLAGERQGGGWLRMPHSAVTRQRRQRAKSLRQRMTRAETLLWRYMKAGHLDGLSFRRQMPIGSYIADFVCLAARVIVEIDRETHDFDERQRSDAARDRWLASQGYVVLRFTNDDVLSSLEGVLLTIRATTRSRNSRPPPSLSLPRKGGGNPQTMNGARSPYRSPQAGRGGSRIRPRASGD